MDAHHCFATWTNEVLSFRLDAPPAAALEQDCSHDPARALDRALRLMQAAGRRKLLVLGVQESLLDRLQGLEVPWLVVETRLDIARHLRASHGDVPLLADTSPWALWLLLAAADWIGDGVQLLQAPGMAGDSALQRLGRLVQAPAPPQGVVSHPQASDNLLNTLSVAAILHPEEPDLEGFFAQLPPWIDELVLAWDAAAPPPIPQVPFPVRQAAQPLLEGGRGFDSQRNLALGLCRQDWVLFLDADERLSPEAWAALADLMRQPGVHGWWLPRETLHPDADHCLVGYGLWPDLQLRLFRRLPGLRFAGAVHERLQGLPEGPGAQAIACHLHIRHEQRLQKNRAALTAKLDRFNALDARQRHRLGQEYPTMSRDWLHACMGTAPAVLTLPGQARTSREKLATTQRN